MFISITSVISIVLPYGKLEYHSNALDGGLFLYLIRVERWTHHLTLKWPIPNITICFGAVFLMIRVKKLTKFMANESETRIEFVCFGKILLWPVKGSIYLLLSSYLFFSLFLVYFGIVGGPTTISPLNTSVTMANAWRNPSDLIPVNNTSIFIGHVIRAASASIQPLFYFSSQSISLDSIRILTGRVLHVFSEPIRTLTAHCLMLLRLHSMISSKASVARFEIQFFWNIQRAKLKKKPGELVELDR